MKVFFSILFYIYTLQISPIWNLFDIKLSVVIIEDLCPGMHSADLEVHHAWFDTTLNTRGSVVTFTCQDGYLFPDGNRIKSTTCLAGGVWSDVIEDCEGGSYLFVFAECTTHGD